MSVYDGNNIPFSHFNKERIYNAKLRNKYIYPAVCAFLCGVLKKKDGELIKPANLVLGKQLLKDDNDYWK